MQTPTPPPSIKRKRSSRDVDAGAYVEPSPTRLKLANLPGTVILESGTTGGGSPRTTMAGHMQRLDLQETGRIPNVENDIALSREAMPEPIQSSLKCQVFDPDVYIPTRLPAEPITPPSSSRGPSALPKSDAVQPSDNDPPLGIPKRPQLLAREPTPRSLTPERQDDSSPASIRLLWWSDAEITGHGLDPRDPTDDGEGINGVGFLPTPAIAYARAERRRRQVKEWKERETREARAKRGERRRRRDPDEMINSECSTGSESNERKVRFVES